MSGRKEKKSINLRGSSDSRKKKAKGSRRTKARVGGAVRKTARSRR